LELSPTQLRLLASLAAHAGQAVTRAALAESQPNAFSDERTIDAHVKNLRARLGPCREQLVTVRGVGYRLLP
jgi:two-component system response regulator BaeR/two-component system response regulator AdeR